MVHDDANRFLSSLGLSLSLRGAHVGIGGVLLGRIGPDQKEPDHESGEERKENHFDDRGAGPNCLDAGK